MTVREMFNNASNGLQHIQYLLKVFKAQEFEDFFVKNKGEQLEEEELNGIKFFYNKDNLILEYPRQHIKYFPLGLKKAEWEEKDGMLILSTNEDVLVYDLESRRVGIDKLFNKKW